MSGRQRGRERGSGTPLAPLFNPRCFEAPTSPDDSRMEEDSPSPVQTDTSQASISVYDGEPTTVESLKNEVTALIKQNKSLADCYEFLLTTFKALENQLKVVQEHHIKDTQDLKDENTTLTSKIQRLQCPQGQPLPETTTTPTPQRPPTSPYHYLGPQYCQTTLCPSPYLLSK